MTDTVVQLKQPAGFDAFWKAYPHPRNRGSKSNAEKTWSRYTPEQQGAAVKAVGIYKSYLLESDWATAAMAQTWLNQKRFEGQDDERETTERSPLPRRFKIDIIKHGQAALEVLDWAEKKCVANFGNPNAECPVIFNITLGVQFADENRWVNLLGMQSKCDRYVKLKMQHEDGFGGAEPVAEAMSRILPTMEQVTKAKADWPAAKEQQERIAETKRTWICADDLEG